MASYILNSVDLSLVPSANQNAIVEYKLSTDSTYILVTSSATILDDGFFSPSVILPDVLEGSCYDIKIITDCGIFIFQVCIDPEEGPGDITIENAISILGNTIDSITPDDWTNYGAVFPIVSNTSEVSTHDAYSGSLTIDATVTIDSRVEIYINDGLYVCTGHIGTGSTSYTFPSVTFLATDTILIRLTGGDNCP